MSLQELKEKAYRLSTSDRFALLEAIVRSLRGTLDIENWLVKVGQPLAELRPISKNKQLRPFGLCAGEFTVPDDFDAPLPEDLLGAFEGK